jgi:hypothetical protein
VKWTDEEEEILKKFYPKVGSELTIHELAEVLGRGINAVQNKAKNMGLRVEHKSNINHELLEQLEKRIPI